MNWNLVLHFGAFVQAIRDAISAYADAQVALEELRAIATSNPDVKADLVRLEGDVKRIGDAFSNVKGLLRL